MYGYAIMRLLKSGERFILHFGWTERTTRKYAEAIKAHHPNWKVSLIKWDTVDALRGPRP